MSLSLEVVVEDVGACDCACAVRASGGARLINATTVATESMFRQYRDNSTSPPPSTNSAASDRCQFNGCLRTRTYGECAWTHEIRSKSVAPNCWKRRLH